MTEKIKPGRAISVIGANSENTPTEQESVKAAPRLTRGPIEVYDPTVLRIYEDLVRTRNISIYGEINHVLAANVFRELQWLDNLSKSPINIWIYSPGGDLFASFAIFDAIRSVRSLTRTIGIGYMASGAGFLLQAGQERLMTSRSWLMLHEVTEDIQGATASKTEEALNLFKRFQAVMLDAFTERSTFKREHIEKEWRKTDWWLSAEECLNAKLIDRIVDEIRPKAVGRRGGSKKKGKKS